MAHRSIHQIFFDFNGKSLEDYPIFVASHEAFKNMPGFNYKLWNERAVDELCRERYPTLWPTYKNLPYKIQKVDLAKYLVADSSARGSWVVDLDVVPQCPTLDVLLESDPPYVFDRCSRKHVIANDFFYVGAGGLPGIFEYFLENLKRVDDIAVYAQRRMRYIFHTSGPDFFTRYLKRAGLAQYTRALSDRTFLDARQRHRDTREKGAAVKIVHHLSWADQVRQQTP